MRAHHGAHSSFLHIDIYTLNNMFAIGTGVLGIIASVSHQLKTGGQKQGNWSSGRLPWSLDHPNYSKKNYGCHR